MSNDFGGGAPPPPPPGGQPPPPGEGWQQQPGAGGWQQPQAGGWAPQQPQQIVVKQGAGCLKIGLIVLGVLAILGIGMVGCIAVVGKNVVDEIDKSTGEAAKSDYDLTGPKCTTDEVFGPQATGTIKNTSDKKQGFQVTVRFTGPDGVLLSEDSDFTDAIDVGQTAEWKVISLSSTDVTKSNCAVSEVSYHIFDNED